MKEPLWMPRGSVRAIVALLLVGAFVYSAILLPEVAGPLGVLAAVVVNHYFETRRNEPPR